MDLVKIFKDMTSAKKEPSEKCPGGTEHNFEFAMHADGRETYSNFFRCSNCNEMIVKTHKRTKEDKQYWQD